MSDERADEADAAKESGMAGAAAPRQAKRAALAAIIVISVAFIWSSAWQIISAVFGFGFDPLPSGAAPGSAELRCGAGIHALAEALDRAGGRLAAVVSADDTAAVAALRPGLSPEWEGADAVRTACEAAKGGPAAWAALQRLRMAEEQAGRLDKRELAEVRRDVAAHLPADLR